MTSAVEVSKPRLTYQQFLASQQQPAAPVAPTKPTIAALIERYLEEMKEVRPCGASHVYTLRASGRRSIGTLIASKLTTGDVIAYARARRQEFVVNTTRHVGPATIAQEISYLAGVLKYAPVWKGCEDVSAAPIIAAKTYLKKQGLIATSVPRDRRPAAEEIATLEELAHKRNQHPRTRIDMVKLARWQIASSRRVSETCRLEWLGWNPDLQTMVVTKVKDPRNRDKTKVAALTEQAQLMLFELAWEINDAGPAAWADATPLIFHWKGQQWNAKCASQAYADLKTKAGIKGLRLHDSRAECASRLIEEGYAPTEAILVTLHETDAIFQRRYMRLRPENFKRLAVVAVAAANERENIAIGRHRLGS